MRLLAYCGMPNHFHLALWPYSDGDLGKWMQWLLRQRTFAVIINITKRAVIYGKDGLRLSPWSKTITC